jgi:hypothetical protein
VGGLAEPGGQAAEGAVGQDADVAWALAGDGGHLGDLEAGDHAQEHHLGLVVREGGDQRHRGPAGDGVDGRGGRVVEGGQVDQGVGGHELVGPAGAAAPTVDGPVAGDDEHPGPERPLVAGEAVQPAHHPQPGLGGQVLAGPGGQGVEVAQQARLQVAPEDAEGQLVATGGGGQHGLERGADHRAITLPVSAGTCQPGRLCPLGTARPLRVRISATRRATVPAVARGKEPF